jgi:hypothetical protein
MTRDPGTKAWRRLAAALFSALLPAAAGAHLCASDPVPAATLLFFVRGRYSASSTAANPVADRTSPTTTVSITNVTASPRVVNLVLHNDFGVPLLGWNAILTGYDVVTLDFADILEGYLVPTGPYTNPSTGRLYSPTGNAPLAGGPLEQGAPDLGAPGGTGIVPNGTTSLFGLCTNPTYTAPFTVDPGNYRNRLPQYNRAYVYNGLRKSQVIAENQWWGNYAPYYVAPDWLRDQSTDDPISGFLTVDVTAGCSFQFPWESGYFQNAAVPRTVSYYAGNPATNFQVDVGNSIVGDWHENGGPSGSEAFARSGSAVAIEVDNQDIVNSIDYPREIREGATFYRYEAPRCGPAGQRDDLVECLDRYTGSAIGMDYVTGAPYVFGPANPLPTGDFREPLPTAFAVRWLGGDTTTRLRVWKEFPDTYPYYGYTYVYSFLQYTYYAWDDEERVFDTTPYCPVPPCEPVPAELNQLPLAVQEIDVSNLLLPDDLVRSGWLMLAMVGSNGYLLPVWGGYTSPFPQTYGSQCWVEAIYTADGRSQVVPGTPVGNFLCEGTNFAEGPDGGMDYSGILY